MSLQGIGFNQPALPQASPNSAQDDTQISPNTSPQESLQDKVFHPSHPISYISEAETKQLGISDYLPNFLPSQVKNSDFREINEEAGISIKFLPSQVEGSDSREINQEAGSSIKFLPGQVKDSDSGEINQEAGRFINVGYSIEPSLDDLIQKLNKCFQKVRDSLRNHDVVSIEPTMVKITRGIHVWMRCLVTTSDGKLIGKDFRFQFSKTEGLKIMQHRQSDGPSTYKRESMRLNFMFTSPPFASSDPRCGTPKLYDD